MTHRRVLQDILDTNQVSLNKNNKINFPFFEGAENYVSVTVAFWFISECTVLSNHIRLGLSSEYARFPL
jgi:hypothetical protein